MVWVATAAPVNSILSLERRITVVKDIITTIPQICLKCDKHYDQIDDDLFS